MGTYNNQTEASDEAEYMSDEQIALFKSRLVGEKRDLQTYLEESRREDEDPSTFPDPVDRSSYEEERTALHAQRSRAVQRILQIDQALSRIINGEFGYCLQSGEPIGLQRLTFDPAAALCLEEQARIEHARRWG